MRPPVIIYINCINLWSGEHCRTKHNNNNHLTGNNVVSKSFCRNAESFKSNQSENYINEYDSDGTITDYGTNGRYLGNI